MRYRVGWGVYKVWVEGPGRGDSRGHRETRWRAVCIGDFGPQCAWAIRNTYTASIHMPLSPPPRCSVWLGIQRDPTVLIRTPVRVPYTHRLNTHASPSPPQVFINGVWLGIQRDPTVLIKNLRAMRRQVAFDTEVRGQCATLYVSG